MSVEPHVYEKQHFAASRRGKNRIVEHGSTVVLFNLLLTKVNSFVFFENQGEKFSFFSLEKPV